MPLINKEPKRMGNIVVTEFVDSVGTDEVTFTFLNSTEHDTFQLYNISPKELVVTVGAQVQNVPAYQVVKISEAYSSFKIKALSGVGGFRATCSYEDSDEEDEVILGDRINQLTTSLAQSATQLSDIALQVRKYKTDVNTWTDAVNLAIQALPSDAGKLIFPAGTFYLDTIITGKMPLFVGQGSGVTILKHTDGISDAFIKLTKGSGVGEENSAIPYGGFEGLSIQAGSVTTSLIYFSGNVDNNAKFYDLALKGNLIACDGISCRDYINFELNKLRFDRIGGYAIKVREASQFYGTYLHLGDFTYDNYKTASSDVLGQGLLYINATNLQSYNRKGTIKIESGRLEINSVLQNKELIRIIQSCASGGFQHALEVNNVAIYNVWSQGKLIKLATCNGSTILQTKISNVHFEGFAEVYNNDNKDAQNSIACRSINQFSVSTAAEGVLIPGNARELQTINKFLGKNISSANGTADAFYRFYKNGDVAYLNDYTNDNKKVFAYVAYSQNARGLRVGATGAASLFKVDGTSGSNTITINDNTFNAYDNRYVTGLEIVITGAGASGANLTTVVTDVQLVPATPMVSAIITIADTIQTSVSQATVNIPVTGMYEVPIIGRSATTPSATNANLGDVVLNSDPNNQNYLGWIYKYDYQASANGFVPFGQLPAQKGTTANRPTGVYSGYMYLDTSLSADGKPIFWNGSTWVYESVIKKGIYIATPSIPANGIATSNVTVTGIKTNSVINVTLNNGLFSSSVLVVGTCSTNDTLTLTFRNFTGSTIATTDAYFSVMFSS